MQIEYVDTQSLSTYANNAKIHTAEQIEQIKRSIKEFGFVDPVGVWNDVVAEGNGRVIAATELGIKKIPIIRLDKLSEEQFKAYVLVHNQLTLNTGFDNELLAIELSDIPSINMTEYGFVELDETQYFDDDYEEVKKKKYLVLMKKNTREKELSELLKSNGYKFSIK